VVGLLAPVPKCGKSSCPFPTLHNPTVEHNKSNAGLPDNVVELAVGVAVVLAMVGDSMTMGASDVGLCVVSKSLSPATVGATDGGQLPRNSQTFFGDDGDVVVGGFSGALSVGSKVGSGVAMTTGEVLG
jgi:hypothetical protein